GRCRGNEGRDGEQRNIGYHGPPGNATPFWWIWQGHIPQKIAFRPICRTRAPVDVDAVATVVILPNVPALRFVLGSPNCGWFRTLKASKRYSSLARSLMRVI